jgi:hypothetical protein
MSADTATRPAGLAAGALDLLRIHSGAAHLHSLGARSVGELLAELAGGPAGPAPVLGALERYRRLTRAQVVAAGADRPLRPWLKVAP